MQSGTHQLMTSSVTELLNRASKWCFNLPFSYGRTHQLACTRTCSPAHCCRHQALAPRSAEYISITGMHMLPVVTDIMQTRRYAEFADRVLTSHDRAHILDTSPAMRETLAEMQACLKQLCGMQRVALHCMQAPRHDGHTDSKEVCSN